MLFGWELILAFILVSTVYACAIGAPNFGNIAPLAVGVSLALDLMAAAAYSGGGVSPVRVLGPAIVFHCNWDTAWVYMLGGRLHQFCQDLVLLVFRIPLTKMSCKYYACCCCIFGIET